MPFARIKVCIGDAASSRGTLGAGVYFLRMDALGQSLVRKIAVTR